MDCGLDGPAASLHCSAEIFFRNSSCTEHVAVGEPLSGNITDWKFRQNDLYKEIILIFGVKEARGPKLRPIQPKENNKESRNLVLIQQS